MNTKTMEGLAGAKTNMNLLNTPMRIFKEARRRGDTATMERAMGYVGDFADKTEEYKAKADKGMEEDARAAREKAELEREKSIRKRKEEREKLEERIEEKIEENRNTDTELDNASSDETKTDVVKAPVTYTKTGELSHTQQNASVSILL